MKHQRRFPSPEGKPSVPLLSLLSLLALAAACASGDGIVSYEARRAHVMNELGVGEHRKGNLDTSLFYFRKALRHAEAADDRAEALRAHVNLGQVFSEQGALAEAALHLEAALRIARDMDDDTLLFTALEAMGKLRNLQERYGEAEALLREALERAEDLDAEGMQALALNDLGVVLRNEGRIAKAVEAFHHALVLYESRQGVAALEGRASVSMNLAAIRFDQGRYLDAWNMLTNSLSSFQQLGDKDALVSCHLQMARLLEAWGKTSDALLRYERAFGTAKEIPDPRRMEESLENILRLSETLGMGGLHDRYLKVFQALRAGREAERKGKEEKREGTTGEEETEG